MPELDTINIVVYATEGVLLAALGAMIVRAALRARRARSLARGSRPISAPVVSSMRSEDTDNRSWPWSVETRYEVPGLGVLRHRKAFETEGKAILYGRLHKVGVIDPVIPNLVEPGEVLLPADLQSSRLGIVGVGALLLALGLWQACEALE